MFLKFEHYDLAVNEVSHYEFLSGHSSITLEDFNNTRRSYSWIQEKTPKNKMKSLLSEGVF